MTKLLSLPPLLYTPAVAPSEDHKGEEDGSLASSLSWLPGKSHPSQGTQGTRKILAAPKLGKEAEGQEK